jgi:hypothetical protein
VDMTSSPQSNRPREPHARAAFLLNAAKPPIYFS